MRNNKVGISMVILLLVAFAACGGNSNGAPKSYTLQTKLSAVDSIAFWLFGEAVAVSGNTMVVGAPGAMVSSLYAGAVYVFRHDGRDWIYETKLTASDGADGDWFGQAVAISGEAIVVGAPWDDDKGSAYVYRYDGSKWQETKLTASDGAIDDCFGQPVAIDGDTIVVGASGDDDGGAASGSLYVYRYDGSNWQETRLTASNSFTLSGDTILLAGSNAVYIYRYNGASWIYETKIMASIGTLFGDSIAVSGDTIVVGALGSAYIYRYDGNKWQETKITASDGAIDDFFGHVVAISGDTVVIGAFGDDDNGLSSGSAYIYRYDGSKWQETKITASDGAIGDFFGNFVAISGDTVVIGSPGDDDHDTDSGSVYVYRSERR